MVTRMITEFIPSKSRLILIISLVGLFLAFFLTSSEIVHAQVAPPEAMSEQGRDIRDLWFLTFALAAVVFIGVEVAIVWIVMRYRRKKWDSNLPPQIHGSKRIEVVWTVIPTIIVAILFAFSLVVLLDIESEPDQDEPVETIDVMAQQWTWGFRYSSPLSATTTSILPDDPASQVFDVTDPIPFKIMATQINPERKTIRIGVEHLRVESVEGNTVTVTRGVNATIVQGHKAGAEIDRVFLITDSVAEGRLEGAGSSPVVTVPTGKTVRFNLASKDVIHSFYIPQFLYKLDANPGRVQALWVNVSEATGWDRVLQGQCAEFCGREHARMIFSVRSLEADEYRTWLTENTPPLEEMEISTLDDGTGND